MKRSFKMSTPEGLIKNAILDYLKLHHRDFLVWQNDSVGVYDPIKKIYRKNRSRHHKNGVSDIIGLLKGGRFLAIEVKSAVGKVSPEQKEFITEVNEYGGIAFVARSVKDVEVYFKRISNE